MVYGVRRHAIHIYTAKWALLPKTPHLRSSAALGVLSEVALMGLSDISRTPKGCTEKMTSVGA